MCAWSDVDVCVSQLDWMDVLIPATDWIACRSGGWVEWLCGCVVPLFIYPKRTYMRGVGVCLWVLWVCMSCGARAVYGTLVSVMNAFYLTVDYFSEGVDGGG
mmetsp:Transcript_50557/g.126739  ORF Transcript_50557/g.126739 Transcript_50557/m.126739 type:complete len:102 (+) Transcript_50557:349-654(+)